MCIVFISQQTATFALHNINWFVFFNRDEKCLLRGTNWVFKWNSLRFFFKVLTSSTTTSFFAITFHWPDKRMVPEQGTTLLIFTLFVPCTVNRTHTTFTNKWTVIIPCYVIQYSHSELVRHVSIPCWDHHQGVKGKAIPLQVWTGP
jgi:hypothetical protein